MVQVPTFCKVEGSGANKFFRVYGPGTDFLLKMRAGSATGKEGLDHSLGVWGYMGIYPLIADVTT